MVSVKPKRVDGTCNWQYVLERGLCPMYRDQHIVKFLNPDSGKISVYVRKLVSAQGSAPSYGTRHKVKYGIFSLEVLYGLVRLSLKTGLRGLAVTFY